MQTGVPHHGDPLIHSFGHCLDLGLRPTAAVGHMAPLGLSTGERGRIATTGTRTDSDQHVHLFGYGHLAGPASLISVGSTARHADAEITDLLR